MASRNPIPDRLIVLTFDDGCKSCATYAAPLLSDLGFGATFYITEGLKFLSDKEAYATWDEIRQLHEAGFEIGNHLGRHVDVRREEVADLREDLRLIEVRCEENGIPKPSTFAYPGSHISTEMVRILDDAGYRFARRGVGPEIEGEEGYYEGGRGILYDPAVDDPLLIPSAGISGPKWTREDLEWAVAGSTEGRLAVLTYHGVPDPHPHCTTDQETFASWMEYLKDQGCTVIALRDLARYVDPDDRPADPFDGINQRLSVR